MDHISRINCFLEVAKHQSFAGAARTLGVTGPALSKQIKALEEELGVRLLHRTTRQVSLTEEGALYNEKASKALDDLREAEEQLHELKSCPTGKLKVSLPMSFGRKYLAESIASFAREYPNIEMEVDFDDRVVDVISEGYDVVVRIGTLPDSTLIARKLASSPEILCASPEYLDTYGLPKFPKQLANYPAVIYSKHGDIREWRYKSKVGTGSITLHKKFSANNAEMMLEACLQGLGLAVLPIFSVAEHISSGKLIHMLPEYTTFPKSEIYALFPQNRHLSTRVRLFVECLSECSNSLPW